jgi:DNA polymerase III delta prime subunit
MDSLNLNSILGRENIIKQINDFVINFEKNKYDLTIKRGVYLYGPPGIGKTFFIKDTLIKLGYDIILYDAGDIRNKCIIDTITQNNMTDTNVLSLLSKKSKPLAIIMDEIDGMNNGDKGGINSLIKVIRPKKTRKQKLEEISFIPIFCIGNYHIDKKINELIKVCLTIPFPIPTSKEITNIIKLCMPKIYSNNELLSNIIKYTQNDLGKLISIEKLYKNNFNVLSNKETLSLFLPKTLTEDTKDITKRLINEKHNIKSHNQIMNETERTIVGLLWHENIIEYFNKVDNNISIPLYLKLLDNICTADYIDRITFQKQIWQFNEMSSLIKVFYNNLLLKNNIKKNDIKTIRFTKVLTKYSTEYNNLLFIQNLCQIFSLDKKDLFTLFIKLKNLYDSGEIFNYMEQYEITKLDVNRIYRYIDKFHNINTTYSYNDNNIDVEF